MAITLAWIDPDKYWVEKVKERPVREVKVTGATTRKRTRSKSTKAKTGDASTVSGIFQYSCSTAVAVRSHNMHVAYNSLHTTKGVSKCRLNMHV